MTYRKVAAADKLMLTITIPISKTMARKLTTAATKAGIPKTQFARNLIMKGIGL